MDDDRPNPGLHPFDLQAPVKILYPQYTLLGRGPKIDRLQLGQTADTATFERFSYPDGTVVFRIEVPCDRGHCYTCECSTGHYIDMSFDQLIAMRALLGVVNGVQGMSYKEARGMPW
jgi:hypothetical protein